VGVEIDDYPELDEGLEEFIDKLIQKEILNNLSSTENVHPAPVNNKKVESKKEEVRVEDESKSKKSDDVDHLKYIKELLNTAELYLREHALPSAKKTAETWSTVSYFF
jgi:hypothetical protein